MEKQKHILAQRKDNNPDIFYERIKIIKVIFSFLFCIIFFSLFNIQIFNHSKYSIKWKKQGYIKIPIPVPRGKILDRNGKILSMSIPTYSLYLDSWKINHYKKENPSYPDEMKKYLVELLGISEEVLEKKMSSPYPLIKKELSFDEYQKIKSLSLPGIVLSPTFKRVYPYGKLACHVLGFVGADGKGLEGIEFYYDKLLKGKEGMSLFVKDGNGNIISSLEKKLVVPKKGSDIVLSIDFNIQTIVEEEIEKAWIKFNPLDITVVVMDPKNGEILALANKPNYDLNNPGEFPASFRRNRAITDLFEPGSIFKIVTATACFEEKIVSPLEIIDCENGKWFVRAHYLHDAKPHNRLTVEEVIMKSSNIGTVKMAMRIGEKTLYKYCKMFKFGELTGIDLPGEIPGILRPINKWSGYSITAVPIGQEVGINTIQGIRAMAIISNGGYFVNPHLLKEIHSDDGKIVSNVIPVPEKIISDETCITLSEILEKVVSPEGTAPLAQIPGYRICGKTGTAQKIENGIYSSTKYLASFVGYVLKEEPKVIILVQVNEPKNFYYGGAVSAPIFRNIAWRIMQYWNIPPDENLKKLQLALYKKQENTSSCAE